ncbi:hypothetical protein P9H05_09630 [Bacillus atrophaeus]|nr:hypothetical protein [Bacillus atrophaeus]
MMKTYLMLTAKTDCFGTGHVPGHYAGLDRLQAENRLKHVRSIQRCHGRLIRNRGEFVRRSV